MKKGFTLVEVTVALALFGIAVVVLTQSFLSGIFSLESFKFDNTEDEALMFVYGKVLAIESRASFENGGSITTANNGIAKWSGTVQSTPVLELYKVRVNVAFQESKTSAKRTNHTEEFHLYRPKWAEPGERDEFLKKDKGNSKS